MRKSGTEGKTFTSGAISVVLRITIAESWTKRHLSIKALPKQSISAFIASVKNAIATRHSAQSGVNHHLLEYLFSFSLSLYLSLSFLNSTKPQARALQGLFSFQAYSIKNCNCGFALCGAAAKYRATVPTAGVWRMQLPNIFEAGAYKFLKSASFVKLFMLLRRYGECAL